MPSRYQQHPCHHHCGLPAMPSTGTATVQGLRPPMAPLRSEQNIPLKRPAAASLTPLMQGVKIRERETNSTTPNPPVKKVKTTADQRATSVLEHSGHGTPGPLGICHQCHQEVQKSLMVQCTRMKRSVSNSLVSRCVVQYCVRCIRSRYDKNFLDILSRGEREEEAWHYPKAGYYWTCFTCDGTCNCRYHIERDVLFKPTRYIPL
jgi:hypothetical protein